MLMKKKNIITIIMIQKKIFLKVKFELSTHTQLTIFNIDYALDKSDLLYHVII